MLRSLNTPSPAYRMCSRLRPPWPGDLPRVMARTARATSPALNSSRSAPPPPPSDSDSALLQLNVGPSKAQLAVQKSTRSICLQATQELTSLQVLECEVNVRVDPPVLLDCEAPSEPGTWREVMAECRVDLVPFTITFCVHQPGSKFASCSYHGLRAAAVKEAHARELARSVLPGVRRPSDAVQLPRSPRGGGEGGSRAGAGEVRAAGGEAAQ
ncbi:unnamed protein product [Plutella xylostella]|uniref:(diamondback moth) hypothetical protein n=1 Tax=Plutella xylostella TaxID=51655 RepID=A0A8S4G1S2_PLUXY|nr:unnamed protein product [Plutella xylostella]